MLSTTAVLHKGEVGPGRNTSALQALSGSRLPYARMSFTRLVLELDPHPTNEFFSAATNACQTPYTNN